MINKISVIGLGYVGLPLAVAFAEKNVKVIGFDVNESKIDLYKKGIDPTNEVGNERLNKVENIIYSSNQTDLNESKFHIVAVPTPVGKNNIPNLKPVEGASEIVGKNLTKGSIVVFESTVYPGVTEEVCVPILERESGLKCGIDFKVGYSPERINPGDKVHTLEKIVKIVSGMDDESLNTIAETYEMIIKAGVHRASSIRVAEAAKVIENAQRDVNIAFVNELSMIFERMGIDTQEVLSAASTKWNFLPFKPGLVGGHCIGVDPYYLTYKSEELGYISQLILSGRRINDGMSKFLAEKIIKMLIASDIKIKGSKVLFLGLTFKENCPDLRNTKIYDVINDLKEFGVEVVVTDPLADDEEAKHEYNLELSEFNSNLNNQFDGVVFAVSHKEFTQLTKEDIKKFYKNDLSNPVLIDVKAVLNKKEFEKEFNFWRM